MNNEPQMPKSSGGGGGTGPVIAIIVIIIILALGGIYYLTQSIEDVRTNDTAEGDQRSIEALMNQGSDDAAAAIMADLEATDFTAVDQAVAEVDASVETE